MSPAKCEHCGLMTRDAERMCIICRLGPVPWNGSPIKKEATKT